jgi:hypothetical protein
LLPHYGEISEDATAGTERHAGVDLAAQYGRDAALQATSPEQATAIDDATEVLRDRFGVEWAPALMLSEASCALDVVDGEVRRLGWNREYAKAHPRTEIAGTWDLLIRRLEGEPPVLVDWKGPHSEVTHPERNLQLRALAVMASRLLGEPIIEIAIIRLPGGWTERATMLPADIEAAELELREIHRAALQPDAPLVQGAHCRYCPAYAGCPAKILLVRAMSGSPAAVVRTGGELTLSEAAEALRMWKIAREVLGRIGQELHTFATRTPIPCGEGVWGPVVGTRQAIDGATALRVLEEVYGRDVAEAACERRTSQAAIERAVKPVAQARGEKGAPAVRAVIEKIAAAGGISRKTITTFDIMPREK